MFKSSAINTDTVPKKSDIESVGASFGDMSSATSSESKALGAADEETAALKKSLGDDFTLEDTLVFDEPKETSKAGASVGAANEKAADVDDDGIVTISDATEIQRYLAEMDVPEEIGKPIK